MKNNKWHMTGNKKSSNTLQRADDTLPGAPKFQNPVRCYFSLGASFIPSCLLRSSASHPIPAVDPRSRGQRRPKTPGRHLAAPPARLTHACDATAFSAPSFRSFPSP
uniref:Uncharacterized protein n=1 Tax=Aegilops tauschii subsp. strangulata TaxID=200361 RepID=A0A453STX6_AEGTS